MLLDAFGWIEQTPVSLWVRESLWAFPFWLILHAVGMGFLAGGVLLMGFRRIGVSRLAPVADFLGFGRVMWVGFWVSLVSGVFLLAAYPAKGLTNPVFGLKFLLLGASVLLLRAALRAPEGEDEPWLGRGLAVAAMLSVVGAIFAGRFLAYTHKILLAY